MAPQTDWSLGESVLYGVGVGIGPVAILYIQNEDRSQISN